MKTIFYLNIIELCLLSLTEKNKVGKVTPYKLLDALSQLRWSAPKMQLRDVRNALKTIFPIYKNKRCHTKCFKISQLAAEKFMKKHNLVLRPIEHAREYSKLVLHGESNGVFL